MITVCVGKFNRANIKNILIKLKTITYFYNTYIVKVPIVIVKIWQDLRFIFEMEYISDYQYK